MTPLRLELEGFGCFRDPLALSFEELGLFAIAGPTGAGKSTLLDAITYALYGQTARLGARGLDALISPGADRLAVELTFEGAGGTYRVVRTADRGATGNVTRNTRILRLGPDAEWVQLPESERLRDADAKLQEIVGLDYDGFTRAVLLPQGAFDEFLRGDSGKRRKLLTNLLGLDRIEAMQREAGRRFREAETRAQALGVRLAEDYADATPERQRDLRRELERLEAERTERQERQAAREAALGALEEVRALALERDRRQADLERLEAQLEEIERASERLDRAKRAQLLAPQLRHLDTLQTRAEAARAERLKVRGELDTFEQAARAADEARKAAACALAQQRQPLAERIEAATHALPLAEALARRGGDLSLAERAEPGVAYEESAWEELERLRARLPALARAVREARESGAARERAGASLEAAAARVRQLEGEMAALEEAGKLARERHEAAQRELELAVRDDHAAALRAGLAPGDPCPVCGQPVQELPPGAQTEVAAARAAVERAAAELTALREEYQEKRSALLEAQGRAEERGAALEEATARKERAERDAAAAMEGFGAVLGEDGAFTPEAAEARLRDARQGQLAALARLVSNATGGEEPARVRSALTRELEGLERAQREAEAAAARAEQEAQGWRTRAELLERQLGQLEEDLAAAGAELLAAAGRTGFAELAELRAALLPDEEVARLEGRLVAFEDERRAHAARLAELVEQLAGRSFDPAAYDRLMAERDAAAEELSGMEREAGRLQRELASVGERLERARELRRELAEWERRYDVYRQLHLDLRGNQFPEYLLAHAQRQLAARASGILRQVTDGRYDLRLVDGEYFVSDAWHPGDLRSARTLSGGETFIASLALALALSETIAGSHSLGALFLDEGFGTLDALTLESVAGVLEALSGEGRMVGIITHVTELTEKLPDRLLVSKGPGGSSAAWDA